MSTNPQWKTFQPPDLMQDSAILDFKNMTSNGKRSFIFLKKNNVECVQGVLVYFATPSTHFVLRDRQKW